ncbi:MAG: O-methyltransferase [Vicinamibacterales bacterium]
MSRTAVRAILMLGAAVAAGGAVQSINQAQDLDSRIARYLEANRFAWRDMNVPASDGKLLHDIIVERGYKRALEIGTSTGHSGIWIARALAKTGGRLITIEIDAGRHREAVAHFEEAGVASLIDARLADAHDLVLRLEGPFDFVFIDADKDWYTNYAKAVVPKLAAGGCITAHNVYVGQRGSRRRGGWGTGNDYYDYVAGLPYLETTVTPGGMAISYKKKN